MITQINFIFWCFYKSNDSNDDDDDKEFYYDDDDEYYDNDNDEINVVYDIIHNYRCIYKYIHYCIYRKKIDIYYCITTTLNDTYILT